MGHTTMTEPEVLSLIGPRLHRGSRWRPWERVERFRPSSLIWPRRQVVLLKLGFMRSTSLHDALDVWKRGSAQLENSFRMYTRVVFEIMLSAL